MSHPGELRVALVHDWLTGMRGGEKVLEVLCELYPQASLFTLVHVRGSVSWTIERLHPKASILSRLPAVGRFYRHLLPVFPTAIEQIDLDEFDLVISTSHCAAKSVVRPGRARHICYCHTPMRYVWDQRDAYFGPQRLGPVRSAALRPVLAWLARWDAATARRVDRYVANSQHVARRIARYYNRRAIVIYPPVDTDFFCPDGTQTTATALVVSALVPYKRVDVAIAACERAGVPLRIVGHGPELSRLRQQAGPGVEFLGACRDEEIRARYREAGVVLLPGEEDFGLVPVEAQACGRPVVALGRGGAMETVVNQATGILVDDGSVDAFADGIRRALDTSFDSVAIRRHAEAFARPRFAAEMRTAINQMLDAPQHEVSW
ncbi:MAG TPA: glycosyltransferase [Vicinamibacterales bacterium]|jgi:glycosyltransferase involved in cell wall biosynthesis